MTINKDLKTRPLESRLSLAPSPSDFPLRKDSAIDPSGIDPFDHVLSKFEGGGAVHLGTISTMLQAIGELSSGQKRQFSNVLSEYVCSALQRGQLLDLEGLDKVSPFTGGIAMIFSAYHQESIRRYLNSCDQRVIHGILTTYTREGVNDSVYSLIEKKDVPPETGKSREQRKMEILIAYAQHGLSSIAVTEETLGEIRDLGEIIFIAYGWNGSLDRLSPGLAYAIGKLLESTVGHPLPEYRKRIHFLARNRLEKEDQPVSGHLGEGQKLLG